MAASTKAIENEITALIIEIDAEAGEKRKARPSLSRMRTTVSLDNLVKYMACDLYLEWKADAL
jgi:hypothetical protein